MYNEVLSHYVNLVFYRCYALITVNIKNMQV